MDQFFVCLFVFGLILNFPFPKDCLLPLHFVAMSGLLTTGNNYNFFFIILDPLYCLYSMSGSFLEGCEELKSQRDLLAAVQKLLDIPPTPYTELDQTEQDLSYLRALYGNYQHFINFDKRSFCNSVLTKVHV